MPFNPDYDKCEVIRITKKRKLVDQLHHPWQRTCYKTFVRPQLEYTATVWDTFTDINIAELEGAQRRAARFASNDNNNISSVTAMTRALEWESRHEAKVLTYDVYLYKINLTLTFMHE